MSNIKVESFKIEDFNNVSYFEIEDQPFVDDFSGVYANEYLNWGMSALYLSGLTSCSVLVMASWYERSGQAGPFRTLLNRIATLNIEQVICLFS